MEWRDHNSGLRGSWKAKDTPLIYYLQGNYIGAVNRCSTRTRGGGRDARARVSRTIGYGRPAARLTLIRVQPAPQAGSKALNWPAELTIETQDRPVYGDRRCYPPCRVRRPMSSPLPFRLPLARGIASCLQQSAGGAAQLASWATFDLPGAGPRVDKRVPVTLLPANSLGSAYNDHRATRCVPADASTAVAPQAPRHFPVLP